jgi:hypothetical protein
MPAALEPVFASFTEGPTLVARAIEGIDPGVLNRPGREGWSVRDVLIHLSDAELIAALRFRMILAEDRPTLPIYDQAIWKRRLHYLWRSPEAALSLFQQTRFGNAEILRQCAIGDWDRVGVHPERGEMTLAALLELYAGHATEHVAQIESLR